MKKELALMIILIISIIGILFSGYLSYSELAKQTCALGSCTSVLNIPACVYGLVMYCIVFIISYLGLFSKKK